MQGFTTGVAVSLNKYLSEINKETYMMFHKGFKFLDVGPIINPQIMYFLAIKPFYYQKMFHILNL